MKFILVVFMFISTIAKADDCEKSILDCFSFSPRFSLGAGVLPMSDNKSGYVNVKLNLVNYGSEDAGVKFLGIGYGASSEEIGILFSPMSINANKWLVSFDIFGNNAKQAGVSFGISF